MKRKKSLFKKALLTLIVISLVITASPALFAQDGQSQNIYQTNHFADIAEEVNNGVVKVTTTVETSGSQQMPERFNDPYFRFFFGDRFQAPEQKPRQRQGFGSGFIVSKDGYIVTNQHVIDGADEIEVSINGIEDPVSAEVAWSDFSLDLAVLKIDTSEIEQNLTPLEMGDSDQIRPGDWAIAIGNPLGFEHTVTVGVISATGRPIQIPTDERQVRTYQNLIQLDAAINPGNSGGPLLNNQGKVIGINTAVSQVGQGIGFAIPVNEIKDIVSELQNTGEVTRPWIGIAFSEITKDVQEYFGLNNREGVLVMEVYKDSPAEKAGLKPYDVIKEVDQQKIEKTSDLSEIVSDKEVGDKIMFKVIRNGNSKILVGRIGDKPNDI